MAFAEAISESVALNFDEAGSPVFVTIKKQDYIECILITSTLAADDISFSEDCRESEDVNESTRRNSINVPQTKRKHSDPKINKEPPTRKKKVNDQTTLSSNSTLFNFSDHNSNNHNETRLDSLEAARNLTQQDIEMNDDQDDILLAAVAATTVPPPRRTVYPARPSEAFATLANEAENQSDNETEDEEEDTIPQSPQREDRNTRLRSIFARCFEATYIPKEPSPDSQVYVPDSDTED